MRILVVEDDAKLARFLSRAFQEEGWVVDQVATGAAALEQSNNPYDVMILDWMLPEGDGMSVVRALRQRGQRVPILMLTARSEVEERIAGLDAGADDYLTKPFDLGELLARTRALARRANTEQTVLTVGPIRIDLRQRTALIEEKALDLTAREFGILALLIERAGNVVPRADFLSSLWSGTTESSSNVLDVHLRNLRDKLGDHARMIETVRRVGYRLSTTT